MKNFSIYAKNKSVKAIKKGWCWPAFFFGSIWSLFSGFLIVTIVLMPLEIFLNVLSKKITSPSYQSDVNFLKVADTIELVIFTIFLAIRLSMGARGNKWRQARLLKNGFEIAGNLQSDSKSLAVKAYRASFLAKVDA